VLTRHREEAQHEQICEKAVSDKEIDCRKEVLDAGENGIQRHPQIAAPMVAGMGTCLIPFSQTELSCSSCHRTQRCMALSPDRIHVSDLQCESEMRLHHYSSTDVRGCQFPDLAFLVPCVSVRRLSIGRDEPWTRLPRPASIPRTREDGTIYPLFRCNAVRTACETAWAQERAHHGAALRKVG
jgi:hypothetical protein